MATSSTKRDATRFTVHVVDVSDATRRGSQRAR